MDSANATASRADLKLADVHPEFGELTVGKKIKDKNGGSPQVGLGAVAVVGIVGKRGNRTQGKRVADGKWLAL